MGASRRDRLSPSGRLRMRAGAAQQPAAVIPDTAVCMRGVCLRPTPTHAMGCLPGSNSSHWLSGLTIAAAATHTIAAAATHTIAAAATHTTPLRHSHVPCHAADCPTTIAHWQLRDLVSVGASDAECYCINTSATILYNTDRQECLVAQDLDFLPNCMTYRRGFLAAGGHMSEVRGPGHPAPGEWGPARCQTHPPSPNAAVLTLIFTSDPSTPDPSSNPNHAPPAVLTLISTPDPFSNPNHAPPLFSPSAGRQTHPLFPTPRHPPAVLTLSSTPDPFSNPNHAPSAVLTLSWTPDPFPDPNHAPLRCSHPQLDGRPILCSQLPATPAVLTLSSTSDPSSVSNSPPPPRCSHPQLDVRDTRSGGSTLLYSGILGGSVNNALHVGSRPGVLQLAELSHNSLPLPPPLPPPSPLPLLLLSHLLLVASLRVGGSGMPSCHVPINHTTSSADGSLLLAVGDCESTMVFKAAEAGFLPLATFTEARDAGFCCCWVSGDSGVASAHQDGTVCVWDLRSGSAVWKHGFPAAVRSVKQAPGVLDLLAVAEHQDVVHLVGRHAHVGVMQRLEVSHGRGHDISGIDFSHQGQKLYVGVDDGLVVFDVDVCARHSFASAELV
ncbi:MAG: hypothetical protein WDW36_004900 [Sanguina aurantia]